MYKKVLVTGGAGYIGSHTVLLLLEHGYKVTVVDNLYNSSIESIRRVEALTNCRVNFIELDVRDTQALCKLISGKNLDAVIHFAGLKAVGESVEKPTDYYDVNFCGTVSLLQALKGSACQKIVFSSSATVYGDPEFLPYTEDHRLSPTSPYGWSKFMVEQLLADYSNAHTGMASIVLRYFNPVGAHPSGKIGEDPTGIPNNLMPFITQTAAGKREKLAIFGDDYPTVDGTGVRDYIHVMDLAQGHIDALEKTDSHALFSVFNLGMGKGISVKQMLDTFCDVNRVDVPFEIAPRRSGDIAEFYADASLAKDLLGWEARYSLMDMVKDSWRWQTQNPDGY